MIRVDGTWTSRGRAGAAEIAWTGWSCRNSMGRRSEIEGDDPWTGRGRAVDGLELQK